MGLNMQIKIFQETNQGPEVLERDVNKFLDDIGDHFVSINTWVERVDSIDYSNVLIVYK